MGSIIRTLIGKDGLGYCCPWAFFSIFKRTGDLVARLGVSESTIRLAKAKVRDGEWKCEQCENCMKQQVRAVRLLGKKTLGL